MQSSFLTALFFKSLRPRLRKLLSRVKCKLYFFFNMIQIVLFFFFCFLAEMNDELIYYKANA